MELFKLGKGVAEYYRYHVKGNESISDEMIQKKLTRNIHLALKVHLTVDKYVYLYGNLHIFTKGNTIKKIKNHWTRNEWFYKDLNKWIALNEQLQIDSKLSFETFGDLSYINEYGQGFIKL